MKKLVCMLAMLVFSAVAHAGTGTPPNQYGGFSTIDQTWLNGLAGGQNEAYQYGIAAAGSNQAGATQLPAGKALLEVDSGTGGVALPSCLQGSEFSVYNNTGSGVTAYPSVTNNPVTGSQDTINNTTSLSMSAHTPYYFGCASNGVWSAK